MLGLLVSDDRLVSTIVSDRGIEEIVDFFKARGVRITRSTTPMHADKRRVRKGYLSFPELAHLNSGKCAFYTIRGDAAWIAQRDIKLLIPHRNFELLRLGHISLQTLLYEKDQALIEFCFAKILKSLEVPCDTVPGRKGREVQWNAGSAALTANGSPMRDPSRTAATPRGSQNSRRNDSRGVFAE